MRDREIDTQIHSNLTRPVMEACLGYSGHWAYGGPVDEMQLLAQDRDDGARTGF